MSSTHSRGALGPVPIAVVTVSDTRTPDTDQNGLFLKAQIAASGNTVASYHLVHDDTETVMLLAAQLVETDARIIIFNGGTGIAPRDNTFDAISTGLEKTLPGFGELFRMLSYEQIGSASMLSRATAGMRQGKMIFSVPGSPAAVQLAWEKLIAPEIDHICRELDRAS
jgi:molybdenum cofactor biosynthesis protein B